jgi:hypothetical protein
MRQAVRRPSPLLLSLLAALLAVLLAACAGSVGDDDAAPAGAADKGADEQPVPDETHADAPRLDDAMQRSAAEGYGDSASDGLSMELNAALEDGRPTEDEAVRKIIAKGNVSLHSDDVEQAAFDATAIADQHGGEVTERETTTNDDGEVKTARLLLRIPVADFGTAFTELENVADLQSSNTGQEDVTTKVIDTQVRIRAQRRSLARVEALFDRAQSISDIIRIESQVSRRQADLESLERRLSYLDNQTSMSTISVNISLPPKKDEKQKEEKKPEETGFLAGLDDGWTGLKSFATDVATLTGQVLPFAGILLLIGIPLWLVVRRFRRDEDDVPGAIPADAS